MPKGEPEVGAEGAAEQLVEEKDCASAMAVAPGEAFPPVLATTRMIGLMELAGGRVLQPLLEDGELSVGVKVDVVHSAATLPGSTVRARARYRGREGKLYRFEVWAEDEGGEVGHGWHERAIISAGRLVEGARRRRR
jgi:fluoroacetyl-CoA thioesterase